MEAVLNSPFGRIILEPTALTIGSSPDNRLVVNNYAISSHHAEIRSEGLGHSITDLGSAYGTFVNDRRLDWDVPYQLNSGDTILIGDTSYTYELRETPLLEATPVNMGDGDALNLVPTKTSRRKLWIPLGIVALVVLVLAGALVYFFVIRSTPEKTLDAFCNSMQKGDYQAAYRQFSPTLQSMQSEPQFASENKVTSCTHSSATQSGGTATANMTTVSSSGTASSGQVSLVQDSNSNWKINALPSTPSITLDAFCNAIKTRDYQTVYNQLSSRVRGQDSEPSFANGLAQSGIATCTHGSTVVSNNIATGAIIFYNAAGQSAHYIVTLIKEGNTWKIDDLTSG